ncbi:MAG: phosphotransferase enzyme family protein [Phycisphaerales bacterium]
MSSAAKITAGELVLVCSRYDLGAIRSLRRFRGGSRQSPKVLIESDRGWFLLKRRGEKAPSVADGPDRADLAHRVQFFLGQRGYPIAGLVRTRGIADREGVSLLELNGSAYEMFRFVRGVRFDRSPAQAREAGARLSELHALFVEFAAGRLPAPATSTPSLSYHNHPAAERTILELPARLASPPTASTPLPKTHARPFCERLAAAYRLAAERAERLGVSQRSSHLIHGDWHPGNLLYSTEEPRKIVAVLDFDSLRSGPAILDVANGAFQFAVSRRTGTDDSDSPAGLPPSRSPALSLNPDRFSGFLAGYRLGPEDPPVVPWLVIQAMIIETVAPIAATGRFGKLPALPALAMAARAAEWAAAESDRLVSLAGRP